MVLNNMKKRFFSISLVLSLAVTITGCGNKEFIKRVGEFQSGIDTTTTAIGTYYSELNDLERDLYLQERLFDPNKDVLTTERDPNDSSKEIPTALVGQIFNAESIKARTDAIQLLGVYGRRLAELAGSDAPMRFVAGTQILGDNFNNLSKTFGSLKGDPTAGKYVSPISSLIGVIGQIILESKRDAALTKAVQEAAPQVRTIINLLESDLNTVIGPQRLTGTKQTLTEIIVNYNTNRKSMNLGQRRKALEEIRLAQVRYDIAVGFNPSTM